MLGSTVSLALLLTYASAVPTRRSNHVLHEKRAMEPRDWTLVGRVDGTRVLPMRFGLAQQNLDKLEDLLMSVSHPDSPQYGKHFSAAEVVDTFSPAEETIEAVTNWLLESGIERERLRLSSDKGWVHLNATVAEVEDLLNTEYHIYDHPSGATQIGCHNYSVPAHIQPHVDFIRPTVQFNHRAGPNMKQRRSTPINTSLDGLRMADVDVTITPSLANCDKMITVDCLRALYNFHYTPVSTKKNSFGIVEFTPQSFLSGDLDLFFRNFSPSLVGVRPKSVLIDGAVVQTQNQSFNFNGESDLDLQYGMALTAPQEITLLQTGDLEEGAGFDNWLDAVDTSFCTFDGGDDPTQDGIYPDPAGFNQPESCGIVAPPKVISISYGQDEATANFHYATRQCNEYAKLGLMGTTVVYSSGDNGVAGFGNVCLDAEHNEADDTASVFNPEFPASCPFVTAVGATQVSPGKTVNDPESACEQVIFSGGGFSNIFLKPAYQKIAVDNYIAKHLTPSPFKPGQFNDTGNARGFPDIAANGANYVIGIDGRFGLVFGTSAAAPVVASMITMVNDARLAIGKGPVGFINPVLYSPILAPVFNDITIGGNQGCGTPGFQAVPGWDPVTGVGTPNFERLLATFLVLP
ncbi:subtilisin-like protein [Panaeolus papilionaceus]|nr:subtilisin-like protein [Panaeolus papilionaceus]